MLNKWQGYIFYILNALRKLPAIEADVFRGNNNSAAVAGEYTIGRKIHWSAFTSSTPDVQVAKGFAGFLILIH